jgi:hypothetical protein
VNQDALFIKTLDDLAGRVTPSRDEYEVLGISSLVRKLLLDEHPLAHTVNRERRLSVRFEINVTPPIWEALGEEPPLFWLSQDALDPETSLPRSRIEKVTLDQFLGTMIAYVRGRRITVKDVVLHTANVVGGVHRGEPRGEEQETLTDLAGALQIGGYQPDIRALQAIGRVVLKGLEPLRNQVESDLPARRP